MRANNTTRRAAALAAAVVVAAMLGGCATAVKEGPAEVKVRQQAAVLEAQMLAAPVEPKPAELSPQAQARIAELERQVAEIKMALEEARAAAKAVTVDSSNLPAPTAPLEVPLPEVKTVDEPQAAAPAGRQKIARLLTVPTEGYAFTQWSSGKVSMSKDLLEKFTSEASRAARASNRLDLVGKPLARTRFLGPTGEVFDLADYQGNRNVVLVFMRGFSSEVCIACSTYTLALARAQAEFDAKGAQVVLVYPGNPSSVPAFVKSVADLDPKMHIDYPILLDVNLGAVDSLMIRGSLAKPSSIVIDKQGLVRYAYVGKRFDDRPPVKTLLDELDRLAK